MLRSVLFALALAAVVPAGSGCASHERPELELGRPLKVLPVTDPQGALRKVAEAVETDPHAGLAVDSIMLLPDDRWPNVHEFFATGPEKHVLEDYIRTHPELAPPAGFQYGYERQRQPEGGWRWRIHCLQVTGGLELRKLARADLVDTDSGPRIRVRLGADDAAAFGRLTAEHVGARIAVVQDDEVLVVPVVMEPITTGVLDVSLAANTRGEAEGALKRLLSK